MVSNQLLERCATGLVGKVIFVCKICSAWESAGHSCQAGDTVSDCRSAVKASPIGWNLQRWVRYHD